MIKMWLKRLIYLILGLVCAGCVNKNGQYLALASDCMEVSLDSAIAILRKVENIQEESHSQQAFFALLWTQARHKCHLPIENDSLITFATNYYMKKGEKHLAAKSLLYKGLVHKQRKEVEQAAEAFALSEQWFEGVEDNQYKALLYNHYGALMMGEKSYEESLPYLKKSYYYKLKGDSIHYIMSACASIAKNFRYLNKLDSAQVYFEKGLQYKNAVSPDRYFVYVKDYANFFRKNGEYEKAEQMLLECEQHITGEQKYSLYSSLATLYYETKDYARALGYAEKVVESGDSVVVRGGLLNLYRIHRLLGHVDESQHYHDLYRVYTNDISMRMKTAEVAAIPHEVKVKALESAHQKGVKVRWGLTVCLIVVALASSIVYVLIRKRHRQQRQEWQNRLAEDDREMSEMVKAQSEKNREIGLLNYQMERKKEQIGSMEQKQKERLQREREKVKEKVDEIKQLKETESAMMREKRELEKSLETTLKGQRELQSMAAKVEHDKLINQRIMRYRVTGNVKQMDALLMQLKHGNVYVGEQIPDEEIRPMIEALLDEVCPAMRQRIDNMTNNLTKQMMCYLIALELDDEEMMYRATRKKLETIRRYHRECQLLMETISGDIGQGGL